MKNPTTSANLLTICVAINTLIFTILSSLHFYWAFGGTLWYEDVMPTNSTGTQKLDPSLTATLIIAFGLLLLALISYGNLGNWDKYISRKYFMYGAFLISIIFFIRAIGDFKFIGFFKTVKGTRFAFNDTHLFSPLCIFIALISLIIFIMKRTVR